MNKKLADHLKQRFPFFDRLRPYSNGFEHDDGWFAILWRMGERMEEYLKDKPDVEVHFNCIKEKFATLRVHFDSSVPRDGIWEIVEVAEKESETTCEKCGSTEDTLPYTSSGWWRTLCVPCWDAYADEMKRPHFAAQVLAEARAKGPVTFEAVSNAYFAARRQKPEAT